MRLVDDSTMGSLGVNRNTVESVRSRHRNWLQHTWISQLLQLRKKIEALMGPMKNLVSLHLSTVTWAVWSSNATVHLSRSFIMKSIPFISPGLFTRISSCFDLNIKSALFSFFFFGTTTGFGFSATGDFGLTGVVGAIGTMFYMDLTCHKYGLSNISDLT